MPKHRSPLLGPVFAVAIVLLLCISSLVGGVNAAGGASTSAAPRAAALVLSCSGTSACPTPGRSPSGSALDDLAAVSAQLQVMAGLPFSVSVVPPPGVNLTSVNWEFGDGATLLGQSSLTATHVYAAAGLDYVYVDATDSTSATHDNADHLLPVQVLSSHVGDTFGTAPDLLGEIAANNSGGANPTALLQPGGSVTVAVVAMAPARTAGTSVVGSGFSGPTPSSGDSSLSGEVLAPGGTSEVTVSFTGAQPTGLTTLTYWQETSLAYNGSALTTWTNYTFTVPVGLGGSPAPRTSSPNPALLNVDTFGMPNSFDPAVDYDTPGLSIFQNVYQTLIAPNGTQASADPAAFVPEIATCVPGSGLCTTLYGTSLTDGTNFTFVISSAPRFYDPATASSWGVYPSDVVFSIARTLAFSTLPCFECNNGWILAQALLSQGNFVWDGGIHGAANNTPAPTFASMTVNGTDCPASATSSEHGCVTFHANANGLLWPEFLSLIADPEGASIVPCGWFSAVAQGAGIPYWTEGNVSGSGDAPCEMPGLGAFGVVPSSMPVTGWDFYETAGANPPWIGTVSSSMAGSGPYYTGSLNPGISYTLDANPAYAANPDCTFSGCQPAAGSYIPTVNVDVAYGGTSAADALANGTMDFAALPQNDSSTLPSLLSPGLAEMTSSPVFTTSFAQFNLDYYAAEATNLTGLTYTAPATLLADPNLRQFLIDAFPNAEIQSTLYTSQGIQYRFPVGGAIPNFLGSTTPTNVSWPYGNPDPNPSDVGSAGYWWSLAKSDSYTGLNCSTVTPCSFPVVYSAGDLTSETSIDLWASSVKSLSGGAIDPLVSPVSFFTLVIYTLYQGPGFSPFAVYPFGWVGDYADASDFVTPVYLPDTTYTYGDAVSEVLSGAAYTGASCQSFLTAYSSLSSPIPIDCQGTAYAAMTQALVQAASMSNGAPRDLLYNEAEQVAQRLGLFASLGQSNQISAFAPWIDPQSVVINPTLQTIPWYEVRDLTGAATPLAVRGPVASANPSPAEVPVHLWGLATGGTGGYTYSWSGLPNGCAAPAAPALNCTPTTSGSYNVKLTVTDQNGGSTSATLALVIGTPSPLSFTSFVATPSSIILGTSTTVTVVTLGGFAPLLYTYTGLPPGCPPPDSATFLCTPTAAGTYTLHVTVQDSQSASVQGTAPLTVTSGPVFSASVAIAPTTTVDVSVALTLTVTATYGTLPITGTLVAPGSCARTFTWTTTRTALVACTAPATAGTYALNLTLTDALAEKAQANGSLIVHATPSITSFGPGTVYDVGETANLSLVYAGGTGPFTIGYSHLPEGCTGGNVTVVACTFTAPGTYDVGVTVTDIFGVFTTGVTKLAIAPALALASFTASPNALSVGQELNLTATVQGGSAPFTFVYSNLPTGCTSSDAAVVPCLPTASGNFSVGVVVHDAAGISQHASASVAVSPAYVAPPPAKGFLSNTLLDEEVLGGLVALAVIAVAAYLIVRRRGAPPEEPSKEAPPEAEPVEEAPASPDPPT